MVLCFYRRSARINKCWHERSGLQSFAVRRSTGNDVSGPLFSSLFSIFSFFFSVATFSHRRSARIKKPHLGAPWQSFCILQAVRCFRQSASAPPLAPLGWNFHNKVMNNEMGLNAKNIMNSTGSCKTERVYSVHRPKLKKCLSCLKLDTDLI